MNWRIATVLVCMVVVLVIGFSRSGKTQSGHHGQGHGENHDWYQQLKQPGTNYGCCDNRDCRPTRAYQDENGNWRAVVDGQWVDVPRRAVLKELAPDGNSHICASWMGGYIFCFIGGSPKS